MGHDSNWLHDHSFHHEAPDKFEITPKTMWESVLLVILVINIIFIVMVLMFAHPAF